MLKASHRFALFFYKFSGLFSLKFKDGRFEVSKRLMFINFFRMVFCVSFIAFVLVGSMEEYELFRKEFVSLPNLSEFSVISHCIATFLVHFTQSILFLFQLFKQPQLKIFSSQCLNMKLGGKHFTVFEEKLAKHFKILAVIFLLLMTLKYFTMMILTICSVPVFLVYIYPIVSFMGFVSFVKNFENYVLASLKEFQNDLKELLIFGSQCRQVHIAIYLKLAKKYQKLHDLVEMFNKSFGFKLTVITCLITATIVFSVSPATNNVGNEIISKFSSSTMRLSTCSVERFLSLSSSNLQQTSF